MITLTNRIDMRPGVVPLVIHLGQYDSDFSLVFELYSSAGNFTVESGTTAMIRGTKTDGHAYDADATINISAKTVTVAGSEQMTAAKGRNVYELVLKKGTKVLSTANFILDVERAAMDADTIASESVLKELNAIIAGAETATEAAANAASAADRAEDAADSVSSASTQIATNTADIADLKADLTEAVNYNLDILIECLRNIVWLNPSAEDLIDQFKYVEDTPEVVSLSAYITSLDSSIVVGGDLDSLRPYLSVKATYDNETSAQVTGYTLSGSLVTGINTITVSYGGKNTQVYLYLPIGNPDHILYELPQNTRTNYTRINSGIQLDATDSDYTVLGIVEDISVFGESTSQHRIVDGAMNPSGISMAKGTNVYVNPSNGNKKYVIMCDAKTITSSEYSDQSHTLKFVARRTFSGANATITVSLFVDGTKIQTRNESRNTAYNGTTHSKPIGVGGTLAISDGSIYNVTDASFSLFRIYDRALTDSEINTILGVTI